jgi:hypothetical protein
MNLRKLLIGTVFVLLLAIALAVGWRYQVRRIKQLSGALYSQTGQQRIYSGGRAVELIIGGNQQKETNIVLILHKSHADAEYPVSGKVYSSENLVNGLRSSYQIAAHPDPELSGVWIDGTKLDLTNGLTVVYISDRHQATNVTVPLADQKRFVADAHSMQALPFVEKWILPRLPTISTETEMQRD